MERSNDIIILCGELAGKPELSHTGRDENYFKFPLSVSRLSGTADTLNIIVSEKMMESIEPLESRRLRVTGEVRSYNNRSGEGPRLVITVFARSIEFTDDDFENSVFLSGTLCKKPGLRKTPMGREICDIMLAVNRRYGRSDYIPCIAWGSEAKEAAHWDVGTRINIMGRMQSRIYIKNENDSPVYKTAFEISAVNLELLEGSDPET